MERPRNILLIDDEEDFLETTSRRLQRRDFDVRTATLCAEALPILGSGWPDVIVLDVMLPDVSGMECLLSIKRLVPGVPVVMLTGHASLHAGIEGLEDGASDYCLKPIELGELVERIIIAYNDARTMP